MEAVVAADVAVNANPKAKVVMITGSPGFSAEIDREMGFINTIKAKAPKMKVLDKQSGEWMREDAQRVMSGLITRYANEINIVYCHDDNMAAGVVNAFKSAGYTLDSKPIIISIGAMADGLPLVKEGWIDTTILQSPLEDARLAVDVATDIIAGKQKESFKGYYIETPPVTKSNVQEIINMHLWGN